ncbi:MAG: NAD(P)-dependent oxidoreductase [Anaerolineales bacterium]
MSQKILIADSEHAPACEELQGYLDGYELICPDTDGDFSDLLSSDVVGLIAQDQKIDAAVLKKLTNLELALSLGRNHSNFDVKAINDQGVKFSTVWRKGPNCVAELAMTLILSMSKDLLISHESVAGGAYRYRGIQPEQSEQWKMAFHWMKNENVHEVHGKRLGIVGLGEIGYELAIRASVMGMGVSYYKRTRLPQDLEQAVPLEFMSLNEMLASSDYICLAVPHTPNTEKMIGASEFEVMKDDAILINICRGGVVDETAMINALLQGQIKGAGLDVFDYEPLPADSPLAMLDNVILTPHIGGGSGTTRTGEIQMAIDEFSCIIGGSSPRWPAKVNV